MRVLGNFRCQCNVLLLGCCELLGALVRHAEDCSHISYGHSSVSHCNSEVMSACLCRSGQSCRFFAFFFGASFHFRKVRWKNNINNNVEFVWV